MVTITVGLGLKFFGMKSKGHARSPRVNGLGSASFSSSHTCCLRWPVTGYDINGLFRTQPFNLCGSSWSLNVYPLGVDNSAEFLSLFLISLSEEVVRVSYGFTIKDQLGGEDCTWTDPEEVVTFSSAEEGNNVWGVDELISLAELAGRPGYTANDTVKIAITMTVYGREDLNSHDALAGAIEKAGEKTELIQLANQDLAEVVSKLPVRRNMKAQKTQEDKIVSVRGSK